MGYFYQSFVLDIVKMLELPSNVEGDMYGPRTDVKCWGNVALQRVTHHQQLVGHDVEMLAKLLELSLRFIGCYLYMREILAKTAAMKLVLLILQLALSKHHQSVRVCLQALERFFDFG